MVVKRLAMVLFLSVFLMLPLSAAMVSFLVIETGRRENIPVHELTDLWENGLMDAFFEAGHIVSNAPIMRLAIKPDKDLPDEAQGDLREALAGGSEFLILALLDYESSSGGGVEKLQGVSLRLFRTKPYKLVFTQQYSGAVSGSSKEALAAIKKAAQVLISHVRG
ncbi:MAG: hypothetical protein LBU17_07410 [Treponema sp.]|nr:hypothetical protein [Treponema sp.]